MIISVFKTNIQSKDIDFISILLDNIDSIKNWNTDLEDCDNILRVESDTIISNIIIKILSKHNFQISELE